MAAGTSLVAASRTDVTTSVSATVTKSDNESPYPQVQTTRICFASRDVRNLPVLQKRQSLCQVQVHWAYDLKRAKVDIFDVDLQYHCNI